MNKVTLCSHNVTEFIHSLSDVKIARTASLPACCRVWSACLFFAETCSAFFKGGGGLISHFHKRALNEIQTNDSSLSIVALIGVASYKEWKDICISFTIVNGQLLNLFYKITANGGQHRPLMYVCMSCTVREGWGAEPLVTASRRVASCDNKLSTRESGAFHSAWIWTNWSWKCIVFKDSVTHAFRPLMNINELAYCAPSSLLQALSVV